MIEEVYKSKIRQQEFEMMALQSQINPHFFYNTLSCINSIAIVNEQKEISLITQYLATYYRTTLNKGSNLISMRDEWSNMCAYVRIQQMVRHHSFAFHEALAPEQEDILVPNLIIQPLVENAILHGLDYCENGNGVLRVRAQVEGDRLIITVSDNGRGMEPEEVERQLTTRSKGYGIYNILQRIHLLYGDAYGLEIQGVPGEGTTARIVLPLTGSETGR
jgi:two-component system sensor histidine kinase YesM